MPYFAFFQRCNSFTMGLLNLLLLLSVHIQFGEASTNLEEQQFHLDSFLSDLEHLLLSTLPTLRRRRQMSDIFIQVPANNQNSTTRTKRKKSIKFRDYKNECFFYHRTFIQTFEHLLVWTVKALEEVQMYVRAKVVCE